MDGLMIGDVAREAGVPQSAIRYYESLGLLPPPPRASGRRRYPTHVVTRLQVIKTARGLGFTLEDIRVLLCDFSPEQPPPARWRAIAQQKLPVIEAMIQRANGMKRLLEAGLQCECKQIEECFLEGCRPAGSGKGTARALPIMSQP